MGNSLSPKLRIDYDPESDTLYLGNGLPASNGEDVANNVTVFFTDDFDHHGVMIEHAAKLLVPILTAAGRPDKTKRSNEVIHKRTRSSAKIRYKGLIRPIRRQEEPSRHVKGRFLKAILAKKRRPPYGTLAK